MCSHHSQVMQIHRSKTYKKHKNIRAPNNQALNHRDLGIVWGRCSSHASICKPQASQSPAWITLPVMTLCCHFQSCWKLCQCVDVIMLLERDSLGVSLPLVDSLALALAAVVEWQVALRQEALAETGTPCGKRNIKMPTRGGYRLPGTRLSQHWADDSSKQLAEVQNWREMSVFLRETESKLLNMGSLLLLSQLCSGMSVRILREDTTEPLAVPC